MPTLIQISDTHLLADPHACLKGCRPQAGLDAVLEAIRRRPPPDLVVASGDLVHDDSERAYRRLDEALAALSPRLLALPGNHDDPGIMACTMRHARVLQPVLMDGWQIVTLNTHVPGENGGRLAQDALSGLDRHLAAHAEFTVIALHHPPAPLGSRWLDAIGLANGEALLRILDRHAQVRALLFGHAHQSFDLTRGRYRLLGTPSTWRQFRPRSPSFAYDRRPPGYRIVRLRKDGSISSRVRRVPYPASNGATSG